jgi:hypothetical protein
VNAELEGQCETTNLALALKELSKLTEISAPKASLKIELNCVSPGDALSLSTPAGPVELLRADVLI